MRQVLSLLILIALVVSGGSVGLAQETIKIGLPAPLTADLATYGNSVKEGAMLAFEQANAKGGVLGKKLEIIVEDDQSRPEQAKTVFEKLIKRDKVVAILGDVTSQCSIAGAPVAQEAGIPVLSPTATAEKFTAIGDCIFRCCYIDSVQGTAMARFGLEDLKFKKFAVLYDVRNSYSVGLQKVFVEYVKAHGGEIVADMSFSAGDVDFKGQLTRLRRSNPQAIYAPGYYSEITLICRQARSLGIEVPLFGSDGWDSSKTLEIGQDAVNGCYFTNHYSPDDPRPEVQKLIAAFKAKYNRTPDALAVLAYDGANILMDAMTRAGSPDSAKIRQALAATRDFAGVTGSITMDKNRNATKPIVIIKIEDNRFKFVKGIKVD